MLGLSAPVRLCVLEAARSLLGKGLTKNQRVRKAGVLVLGIGCEVCQEPR